jgi:hypothetical protein
MDYLCMPGGYFWLQTSEKSQNAKFAYTEFSEVPVSGLYWILAPALDIVGKGDPGMPTRLVDRDRRGWKARVREGPDGDGDLMFVAFLDVEDR